MKNYRFDYQIKDKDSHNSTEHYGLTEDDEFQYAIQGNGFTYHLTYQESVDGPSAHGIWYGPSRPDESVMTPGISPNRDKVVAMTVNIRKRVLKLAKAKAENKIRKIANFFL